MQTTIKKLLSALSSLFQSLPFKKSPPSPPTQTFSSCGAPSCRRPGCIIPTPPSTPFPITTLPLEIQLQVLAHASFWDLQALRHTNHHFRSLIPPPTHDELLAAEKEWAVFLPFHHSVPQPRDTIYACAGCLRLRAWAKFKTGMPYAWERTHTWGLFPHCRFCIECRDEAAKDPITKEWRIGMEWNSNHKTQLDIFWCGKCERTGVRRWTWKKEDGTWCIRCLTVDWGDEDVQRLEKKALEVRRVKRREHVAKLKVKWDAHVLARNEALRRWQQEGRNLNDWPDEFYEDDEPVDGMELEKEENMLDVNTPGVVDIWRYRTDYKWD